jgi:hypothetical protein
MLTRLCRNFCPILVFVPQRHQNSDPPLAGVRQFRFTRPGNGSTAKEVDEIDEKIVEPAE